MTAIKPEIYISWIPRGNISVKTQIFASIIPAEKVFTRTKADTDRRIGNYAETHADTLREIGKGEIVHGDSLRTVKKIETVHGDTSRKIGLTTAHADTSRQVKNICETKADTLRKTGIKEKISAATSRNIKIFERVHGDTQRIFGAIETVKADTSRKMIEKISAATCRKVVIPEKTFADTVIRIPHKLNYIVQPVRMRKTRSALLADSAANSIVNTFKNCNVTSFSVTLQEKTLSDVFNFDAAYDFNINDAINGQLLDYQFNFLVEEINQQDLVKSFTGMYDVDELLYSKIMLDEGQVVDTDTAITSASNFVTAMAHYLDKTEDIKIEDFEPYNMEPNQNTTYRDFLNQLFGWTSRVPQRQINVFIRGGTLHCIQRGMEDSVFDITDLPHSRPIYNKKLLRTMWNQDDYDPADSSEEDISIPFTGSISFGGTTYSYSNGLLVGETHTVTNAEIQSQSTTSYTYQAYGNRGSDKPSYYMTSKKENNTSVQIGTEYIYFSKNVKHTDGSTWTEELSYPDKKKTITTSSTSYYHQYGQDGVVYLCEETETRQTSNYEPEDTATSEYSGFNIQWVLKSEETNLRQTFHAALGNGFYGTVVYENGAIQGSSISQGAPGGAVSQYTVDTIQQMFHSLTNPKPKEEEEEREMLAPIADISFPVEDLELIKELTKALEWLNRKIQETVTVEITDKIVGGIPTINHVIDFTERILLDDAEYFLVSNRITLTPKKLVQNLKLIRWYE